MASQKIKQWDLVERCEADATGTVKETADNGKNGDTDDWELL